MVVEVLNTVVNFSTGASTSVTPGTQAIVARKAWRHVVLKDYFRYNTFPMVATWRYLTLMTL